MLKQWINDLEMNGFNLQNLKPWLRGLNIERPHPAACRWITRQPGNWEPPSSPHLSPTRPCHQRVLPWRASEKLRPPPAGCPRLSRRWGSHKCPEFSWDKEQLSVFVLWGKWTTAAEPHKSKRVFFFLFFWNTENVSGWLKKEDIFKAWLLSKAGDCDQEKKKKTTLVLHSERPQDMVS